MANLTITNLDTRELVLGSDKYRPETLVFAAAGTVLKGTILARKTVSDTVTAAADAGNTGDGTCTVLTTVTGPIVPLVGAYNLECVTAVTHGGIFKLEDPNGAIVATGLAMTATTGAATAFIVGGLTFTLTDGATDFAAGDKFAITTTAVGTMVPFATDGIGGAQIPVQVLTVASTATGAGSLAVRPLIEGDVRFDKIVIDADGDNSNVTAAIIEQLRDYGIIVKTVSDLSVLDNQ